MCTTRSCTIDDSRGDDDDDETSSAWLSVLQRATQLFYPSCPRTHPDPPVARWCALHVVYYECGCVVWVSGQAPSVLARKFDDVRNMKMVLILRQKSKQVLLWLAWWVSQQPLARV